MAKIASNSFFFARSSKFLRIAMKAMAGVVGSVGEKKEDTGTRGYGDSLLAHSSADSSAGDGAWELCLCWSD